MNRSFKSGKNSVNIATLKAKLAQYLRLVRSGEEVTVFDHQLPVAKIIPFEPEGLKPLESVKPQGDFSGFLKMKVRPLEKKPKKEILEILQEDRNSGR